MPKYITLVLFFLLTASFVSLAQVGEVSPPQVIPALNHDLSIPLRDMDELPIMQTPWENGIIPLNSRSPIINDTYKTDPALQSSNGTDGISDVIVNFNGVGAQGFAPPDVSGDVGPNHYMQMVNVRFQIWDKSGNSLLGPSSLGTIWAGFPGPWQTSLNDGDPVVLYDDLADRWVATQFSLPNGGSGPEYLLVAVSQTPDPTGAWYRYGFETAQFPDYPKFGVWSDGYYFSANRFAGGYTGTYAGALERDKMLVGDPANMVLFSVSPSISWSLLPADLDGTTPPPSGAPNYFMQAHDNAFYGGTDGIDIFEFSVDWVTPGNSTFTGPTFFATSPFSTVNGIPQQGTGTQLDDLSERPMQRLQYRNFGTHESMVVCQTINSGGGRAGMRWYELRNTGSWALYQEGTYAPTDGIHRWMGSIAMNANGDISLGYSASSSSMFPEIRYTGRNDGDPLGVMTIPEGIIHASSGSQNGLSRWGDYTQMSVDPDGQTFWYTNEYQPSSGSFNWRTRIASFTFGASCPINPATNPSPANAVIDVSVNLPEISWTNGAGATMVEVWFGKVGNVTMVYDGSLINTWSIPSTLDYNTTYNWSIVGKNDTCSIPGNIWSFSTEHNPNNSTVFADDFDTYTAGQQVACQNPADWTTWSFDPCNATEDPFVSTDFAFSSPNSVKIDADNDLVHEIGNFTNGKYSSAFLMYIPSGSLGYWNVLQEFAGGSSIWGLEVYYNAGGVGSVNAGGTGAASFSYAYDTWIENEVIVDLDADWAELFIDGTMIYAWQWSLSSGGTGGINQLGANDFYADPTMMYYFDDYVVTDLTIIPVELTSFIATDKNGQVVLNWTTATELNNQMFEIERRSSETQYITIGYVDGYGTTTEPQEYSFVDNSSLTGTFFYRLKQIDFGGRYEYSDEIEIDVTGPLSFTLEQNYPNPFNPSTSIKYAIPEGGFVALDVYNLLGEKVASLVNGVQEAGRYEVNFDASNLASGIYVYSLKSGSLNLVKKMILMK
jgi:Secretion system C-terminal sorting domain